MKQLKLEDLSRLSQNELRERQERICTVRGDVQTYLTNLRRIRHRLDPLVYRLMKSAYMVVVRQIDKEEDVYNDAIFNSKS